MIRGAAEGRDGARTEFVKRYERVIRTYLRARWRVGPLRSEIDDAAQEVFIDCFKPGGALSRADPTRAGGFRAYLYGVVRNVARRHETKRARRRDVSPVDGFDIESDEESLGRVFDRAWARAVLKQAAAFQADRSTSLGPEAEQRVALLKLRFQEGRPMRDIATAWQMDRRKLQYEYDKARAEFTAALDQVLRELYPERAVRSERERLLEHFR